MAFNRGSGIDDNLGKRIFQNGGLVLWNPKAVRTHHKAVEGGLREFGVTWIGKTKLNKPFPAPTALYNIYKFYPKRYFLNQVVLVFINAMRYHNGRERLLLIISFMPRFVLSIFKSLPILKYY